MRAIKVLTGLNRDLRCRKLCLTSDGTSVILLACGINRLSNSTFAAHPSDLTKGAFPGPSRSAFLSTITR